MISNFYRINLFFLILLFASVANAQLPAPGGSIDPLVPRGGSSTTSAPVRPVNARATPLPPTTVSQGAGPEIYSLSHSSSLKDAIAEADRANLLNQQRRRFELREQLIREQQFQRPPNLTASQLAALEERIPTVKVTPAVPRNRLVREFPEPDADTEIVDMRTNKVLVEGVPSMFEALSKVDYDLSYRDLEIIPQEPITPVSPLEPSNELFPGTGAYINSSPLDLLRRALSPIPSGPSHSQLPQFNRPPETSRSIRQEVSARPNNDLFSLLGRALSPIPSAPNPSRSIRPNHDLFSILGRALSPIPNGPDGHSALPRFNRPPESSEVILPVREVASRPDNDAFGAIRRALSPIPSAPNQSEIPEFNRPPETAELVARPNNDQFGMLRRALSPIPSAQNQSEAPEFNRPPETAEPIRPVAEVAERSNSDQFGLLRRALSPIPSGSAQSGSEFNRPPEMPDFSQPIASRNSNAFRASPISQPEDRSQVANAATPEPAATSQQNESKPLSFVRRALSSVPSAAQPASSSDVRQPLHRPESRRDEFGSSRLPPIVSRAPQAPTSRKQQEIPSLPEFPEQPAASSSAANNESVASAAIEPVEVVEAVAEAAAAETREVSSSVASQAEALGIDPSLIESGAVKISNGRGGLFNR